ncbi:MAG TPA: NAD(P)/FAD-dependent oxidoreductase [Frankiaceae bacterium]|nr:NAD(P)/FAD-dependent oxidoreductase [Frankiaceae bacterium]
MTARVLVIGGGYVGLYTALRLQRRLRRGEAEVTLVSPEPTMTYQPFLPEAAAGSIEPRHVVVPLRRVLRGTRVVTGEVVALDHATRTARVEPLRGSAYDLPYDVVVVAPGSVARTLPIPGLAENAVGFKTVGEAIYLRNSVLECLDVAASTQDPERRQRALTFVFVGAGYAGVEAFAELEDMAREAVRRYYPEIDWAETRWVLVEAAPRILGEIGPAMADYALERLRKRGMDVRLETRLESAVDGVCVLSDGTSFPADTLVWTAGVKAHPALASYAGLPLDDRGRLRARADLRVEGVDGAWTAGDCAAVPDLTRPGELCGPTAQHAVRQASRLADNLVTVLRGGAPEPYRHKNAGSVASLGLHKGVAQVYGVRLRGWPAWFMHRTYHVSRVPTLNRKVRVVADWTLALFFRRDIVSLGALHDPRGRFPG